MSVSSVLCHAFFFSKLNVSIEGVGLITTVSRVVHTSAKKTLCKLPLYKTFPKRQINHFFNDLKGAPEVLCYFSTEHYLSIQFHWGFQSLCPANILLEWIYSRGMSGGSVHNAFSFQIFSDQKILAILN